MNSRTPRTDVELVAEVLRGSAEACHELVKRFKKPVLSLIVRMVQDYATAEDLAQDAFLKAINKLDTYDPTRKFASWLFKIAHNTAIDHLRRHRPDTTPLEWTSGEDGEERSYEVLAAPADQAPDERTLRAEWIQGIEDALGTLRPEYREILILRFQEDLAYDEIAEVMGLAMGTVKVHLHRARKQLAKQLIALGLDSSDRFSPQ